MSEEFDFDVLVVGSGFGGSVTALRLTEKGYRVGVLEAGARFEDGDFSTGTFDLKKYLWAPALGMYGIQRIDMVKDCLILAGAGVGGGSLVYANTLYEPLDAFYRDPQWRDITDWRSELAPHYDQAKRMLGVVENPLHTPSDDVMLEVAKELGVEDTFHPTPVGVFFGGPEHQEGEVVRDPYFGGAGPAVGRPEQGDPLQAVAAEPRRPEEAPDAPGGLRELVVGEAPPGLEDADAVALLGQPQGGDRTAEPRPDDEDVEVELLAHARPSLFISRRLAVITLAYAASDMPSMGAKRTSRWVATDWDSV